LRCPERDSIWDSIWDSILAKTCVESDIKDELKAIRTGNFLSKSVGCKGKPGLFTGQEIVAFVSKKLFDVKCYQIS
jgi:hypothetical protein